MASCLCAEEGMSTMAAHKSAFFVMPKHWRDQALCIGQPPIWFDPNASKEDLEQGEETCMDCPLAVECLREHAATKEFGLWGGMVVNGKTVHRVDDWVKRRARKGSDKPRERTCKHCGGPFTIEGWDFNRLYCSDECRGVVEQERERRRRGARRRQAQSTSLAS